MCVNSNTSVYNLAVYKRQVCEKDTEKNFVRNCADVESFALSKHADAHFTKVC